MLTPDAKARFGFKETIEMTNEQLKQLQPSDFTTNDNVERLPFSPPHYDIGSETGQGFLIPDASDC